LKYSILKCRFSVVVARQPAASASKMTYIVSVGTLNSTHSTRQPALPWQPFVLHLLGVFLMLASKYELDTTTEY